MNDITATPDWPTGRIAIVSKQFAQVWNVILICITTVTAIQTELEQLPCHKFSCHCWLHIVYNYYNCFTHLWILSWTTRVTKHQKGKTRKVKSIRIYWSKRQWVAVAHQLGLMQIYTSLQTDNHAQYPITQFFTGRMPFLPPNQKRQSTEGKFI